MSDLIPSETIAARIHFIHGKKVLLDRDLAELYGVQTKVLKQAVRRNIERFPDDFMFELSMEETKALRSQNVTLKRGEHAKYRSFAFTEQGVAMLSSVLKSPKAIQVNIAIMRAFVHLRTEASARADIAARLRDIEQMVAGHDEEISVLFEALKQLMTPPENGRKKIGFTAREAQADFNAETMEQFTPQARKRWKAVPADVRIKILNNVWCVGCRTTVGIGAVSARIDKGMLLLEGRCTRCGEAVARVVENS